MMTPGVCAKLGTGNAKWGPSVPSVTDVAKAIMAAISESKSRAGESLVMGGENGSSGV